MKRAHLKFQFRDKTVRLYRMRKWYLASVDKGPFIRRSFSDQTEVEKYLSERAPSAATVASN